MNYFYILKCKDNKHYVGCTSKLDERIKRHQKGQVSATRDRLPFELKCYFGFKNKYKAFEFEKYLKSGAGRAFMKKRLL